MVRGEKAFTPAQLIFQELFIGTLLYAVVLGFFNDYTAIVYAQSFSTIFFASVVLEILTYFVFRLKGVIIDWLKPRSGAVYRFLMFFFVWLVMFFSKFVFVWAIDVLFGDYISIDGFFGILLVVASVTVAQRVAYYIFKKLGKN